MQTMAETFYVTFKNVLCLGSVCVGVGWGRCTLFPLKYSEMSHLVGLLPAAHEHEPIR